MLRALNESSRIEPSQAHAMEETTERSSLLAQRQTASTMASDQLPFSEKYANHGHLARRESLRHRLSNALFIGVASLLVGWTLIMALDLPSPVPSSRSGEDASSLEKRVDKILAEVPLIDGHNDLAWFVKMVYGNHIYDTNFTRNFENGGMPGHIDLPRMKDGRYGGAFWSAFVPCPADGRNFTDAYYRESVDSTLTQIDLIHRIRQAYPDVFSPAPQTAKQALSYFQDDHLLVSPLIIEGLHSIGNSFSMLRLYHSLGVRYVSGPQMLGTSVLTKQATLTQNCHTAFSDAAIEEVPAESSPEHKERGVRKAVPIHNGLSKKGEVLIQEMNRMGMIVDLSHASAATMRDVLGAGKHASYKGSRAPVMFSHSSAYSVCPHPRNVPDDVLDLIKANNGIVMVNFNTGFVACEADPSNEFSLPRTVWEDNHRAHVVKHILHIARRIGWKHVGVGSDFDGVPSLPDGLTDVSFMKALVVDVMRKGKASTRDIKNFVGLNALRVWADVERVGREMRKEGVLPAEDEA